MKKDRKCAFFFLLEPLSDSKICLKCVCGRGSAPDPAGGAYDAPPDPLVGLTPLGACGAFTLASSALPAGDPPTVF